MGYPFQIYSTNHSYICKHETPDEPGTELDLERDDNVTDVHTKEIVK